MVLHLPDSRSNWNLKERRKPEYLEKNLLEQGREPTTNSTHIWRRCRDLNPDHIGGRQELSPLRHPCSPTDLNWSTACLLLECWVSSHQEWMIPPWMDGTLPQLTRSNLLNSKGTVGKKFLKISYRIWDGEEQFLCGTTTFTSRLQNPFDELRINYQPSLRSKPLLWAQLIKQAPWWQPWKMQVLVICNNFT